MRRRHPTSRLPLHRRALSDPATLKRWILVGVLAVTAAGITGRVVDAAEATKARWGEMVPVLVASRAIEADGIVGDAVEVARWPRALVPREALSDPSQLPDDAVAAGPIAAGTPLSALDFTQPEVGDRRWHVAVLVGTAPLPVEAGDRVDLWATVDPSLAGGRSTTRRLAEGAVVVSASDASTVVAVTEDEVGDVAEATALATVTLVAHDR